MALRVASESPAISLIGRLYPTSVLRRDKLQGLRGSSRAAVDSVQSAQKSALYLPYLTPEQLVALTPQRKKGFDVDALTKAGTEARATNAARAYSAQSLGFKAPAKLGPNALIGAINAMDTRPLTRSGIKATACWDFDNTLASGDIFYAFCEMVLLRAKFPKHNRHRVGEILEQASGGAITKHGLAGKSTDQIMTTALHMARAGTIDQATVFFMMCGALKGMHEYEINAIAEELFEKGLPGEEPYKNHFFSKDGVGSVDICKALAAKEIESHIITLGIPIVARIGARYLGIDAKNVHGSELEVQNGKFTGRALDAGILGKHRIAENKVSRLPLFCFGDTVGSDAPMLSRATVAAFVVDPRPDFHEHIAKNHADIRWLTFK